MRYHEQKKKFHAAVPKAGLHWNEIFFTENAFGMQITQGIRAGGFHQKLSILSQQAQGLSLQIFSRKDIRSAFKHELRNWRKELYITLHRVVLLP